MTVLVKLCSAWLKKKILEEFFAVHEEIFAIREADVNWDLC
jgi:hypothetical protein